MIVLSHYIADDRELLSASSLKIKSCNVSHDWGAAVITIIDFLIYIIIIE